MTKHIEGGGPAFPLQIENRDQHEGSQYGMTLRDYFAGQALAEYIAHLGAQSVHAGGFTGECAVEAYRFADAMLAARKGDAS